MTGRSNDQDGARIGAGRGAVWGGVLCGGDSRRMGRDKASLTHLGRSFLSIAIDALQDLERVYRLGSSSPDREVAGDEAVHSDEAFGPRVPDILEDVPGVAGPLAGILAAMRPHPDAAWVFVACDLPLVDARAVAWLVGQRTPGRHVVLPAVGGRVHPLFALYEPSALGLLEDLAATDRPAPSRLVGLPGVAIVEPPSALHRCWTNVNTPEELAQLAGR